MIYFFFYKTIPCVFVEVVNVVVTIVVVVVVAVVVATVGVALVVAFVVVLTVVMVDVVVVVTIVDVSVFVCFFNKITSGIVIATTVAIIQISNNKTHRNFLFRIGKRLKNR